MAEIRLLYAQRFLGTTEKLFHISEAVLGLAFTPGHSFLLTFLLMMFLSAPKEKCCLWGLWVKDTGQREMIIWEGWGGGWKVFLFLIFHIYFRKDKSEQIFHHIQ